MASWCTITTWRPLSKEFDPEKEGWVKIRQPSPGLVVLLTMVVGVMLAAGLFLSSAVVGAAVRGGNLELSFGGTAEARAVVALFFVSLPIHEMLHALVFPEGLRSRRTILGAWLTYGLFYAIYDGPVSVSRIRIVYVLPFLVLSVLPAAGWAVGILPPFVLIFATIHAWACGGDLVGLVLTLQVPRHASLRNQGWKTYRSPRPG